MDFSTAQAAPVRISIDGTAYDLPRFLLPQLKTWVAARQKKQVDDALARLGDDVEAHARFTMYFQPAPVDVQALLEEATSAEGVEYVVNASMEAAGVPEETRRNVIDRGDPVKLTTLARTLLSAGMTIAATRAASGDKGPRSDPSSGQPPTSGGSPTTTEQTPGGSAEPPPASTQAA